MYFITELENLRNHISHQDERNSHWRSAIVSENEKLSQENEEHDDIVMVDVIDVYRNLPRKLLQFHQW